MNKDRVTGKVEQAPEVVMRGFGGADITDQAREVVMNPTRSRANKGYTDKQLPVRSRCRARAPGQHRLACRFRATRKPTT